MKHQNTIYVSTDAFEAENLIEDMSGGINLGFKTRDLSIKEGERISRYFQNNLGISFHPTSFVKFGNNFKNTRIRDISHFLAEKFGFTIFYFDEDDGLRRAEPSNISEREELVKLALQKGFRAHLYGYPDPGFNLLQYSNNPSSIREFNYVTSPSP